MRRPQNEASTQPPLLFGGSTRHHHPTSPRLRHIQLAAHLQLHRRLRFRRPLLHHQGISLPLPPAPFPNLPHSNAPQATEGSDYLDKSFPSHFSRATATGLIRGAYHFAWPVSNATAQADFFIAHGGGWTADGITLPGMLDMESIASKPACWGLGTGEMVAWIGEVSSSPDKYCPPDQTCVN